MSYMSMIRPTNGIVAAGKPPIVTEARVVNATSMYAGRLVKKGTDVDDIQVASDVSGNMEGWLGFEHTAPAYRPSTPGTIYVVDDKASVLKGGGFVILTAATGALAAPGLKVKWASGGGVTAATAADEAWIVGETEDASANSKVLVRSLI